MKSAGTAYYSIIEYRSISRGAQGGNSEGREQIGTKASSLNCDCHTHRTMTATTRDLIRISTKIGSMLACKGYKVDSDGAVDNLEAIRCVVEPQSKLSNCRQAKCRQRANMPTVTIYEPLQSGSDRFCCRES